MPRMFGSVLRRAAGTYLAAFFLAVAAAPHHHVNDAEDLLLDQRSDSGVLVRADGSSGGLASALLPGRLDRDVPCLACFSGDFAAAPAPAVTFVATFAPLQAVPVLPAVGIPQLLALDTCSRAPPRVS